VGAAERHAVDDDASADAGAERQHHEVALAHHVRLGQRRAVRVVVHEHRDAEAGAELLAQRHPGQGDVHAGHDRPRGEVDLRRHPHPDRLGLAGPAHHLPDDVLDAVEKRVGAGGDGGVLSSVVRGYAVDSRDGDLGASYVYSKDHAAFLSPGSWPCKLAGSGRAAVTLGVARNERTVLDRGHIGPRGRTVRRKSPELA
jgi:hypothetical protein